MTRPPANDGAGPRPVPPQRVVMMGVSGTGKTTVGQALADRLGWPFADADAYHSNAAKAKMAEGDGLNDADRAPWLARLAALLVDHRDRAVPLVLACSALKRAYRDILESADPQVRFLWLDAEPATLSERLDQRADHFAGSDLLASQFEALEPPRAGEHRVVRLDASLSPDALVDHACDALAREQKKDREQDRA